ncbi:UDP-2,4-diacetamido-2,4,6-trideoxy-beta-L-altropyranose hydrolase [Pontibacter sp. MBLB2868]|uniref:UDP-2,4-diacetamido-2,4, 6-trideoxy-beta-L-altropyranose hydrolase n=1 Tax=Pontibacter sp. MBLB2868 TaxID=3451555 RepID=UPI003F74AFD1
MTERYTHKDKPRIIFRADGDSRIGLGHVVRSLALVQMLGREFECVFAIQAPAPELQEQIKDACDGVITLPACAPDEERFMHELDAYIAPDVLVVLDGYNFTTAYQKNIKSKGCPLVCIDDVHAFPFVADVVLNQAGGVDADAYKAAPYTKLLLGPQYALLRRPFLEAAREPRAVPPGETRVFLNLGGADPQNRTLRVARELEAFSPVGKVELVVGSAYRHLPELQEWLQDKPAYKLHQNLDAEAMCRLMRSCAVAITSASGVAYEYAAVGGLLFVLQTAENQAGLYRFLTRTGLAKAYEILPQELSRELTASFQQAVGLQRQFFDGKSDERLREVFQVLALMASVTIREVTIHDLMLLFDWANDPEVRKQSFNPDPILLESHTRWLKAKLEDERAMLYIAEADGVPAAHIRFELENGTATISYLIGPAFRGRSLGHVVLQKGVAALLRHRPEVRLVEGLVQKENLASVRAFEKAGFRRGMPDPQHPKAYRFLMEEPQKQ